MVYVHMLATEGQNQRRWLRRSERRLVGDDQRQWHCQWLTRLALTTADFVSLQSKQNSDRIFRQNFTQNDKNDVMRF